LGITDLEFGGQGDPINYEGFGQIADVAYDLGFKTRVLSYIQNKEILFEKLHKLSMLTVNLNATNEEEFQKIHYPTKKSIQFESTLDILGECLRLIKEKQLSTKIKFSYVIHRETYKQSMSFPEKLFKILKDRYGHEEPIHITFHHMLITPANYAITPNKEEFQEMLELFEEAKKNDYIRNNTNILSLLQRTREMVSLYGFFGPFKDDTLASSENYGFIKEKVNGRFWCDGCNELIFVDCNGDIFGCYNPTRMVYGFPKEEDHMFFGNVLDEPYEEILRKKNAAGRFYPDLTKRFWKVCVVCGLNRSK